MSESYIQCIVYDFQMNSIHNDDQHDDQQQVNTKFIIKMSMYRTAARVYLPEEGEEVEDVVHVCGVLDVATVNVHGVVELLAPRGRLQLERVQVLLGLLHDTRHDPVKLCK